MTSNEEARKAREALGLVEGLPLSEILSRLALARRASEVGERKMAIDLAKMDEGRLYLETGHSSTAHYAEDRLDLDPRRTSELIALGKRLLARAHGAEETGGR